MRASYPEAQRSFYGDVPGLEVLSCTSPAEAGPNRFRRASRSTDQPSR